MRFFNHYKLFFSVLLVAGVWKFQQINEVQEDVSRSATSASREDQSMQLQHPFVPVLPDDYIFSSHLGAAPIVIESHKLIFFYVPKVGCTVLKQLFRRMMGYDDWKTKFPHNSRTNGLLYLNQMNNTRATEIMNSPEYTRAIIVRDPKERFLSAYLDKVLHDNSTYVVGACCKSKGDCWEQAQTFTGFLSLTNKCLDTHWRPQSQRMEPKYLPLLDFVGHMDTMERDMQRLLKRIGAWKEYGSSGWGADGDEHIFQSSSSVHHATSAGASDSWSRLAKYYTPKIEVAVEEKYAADYEVAEYHLKKRMIEFDDEKNEKGEKRHLRPSI